MSAKTKHITIDVLVDGDEISGQAGDGEDQPSLFTGWVGLIWVLDDLFGFPTATAEEQTASN